MYVQDFTGDKDALLAEAFKSPKLHPKKNPTHEIIMRGIGDTVAKVAKAKIAHEIDIDLMDAVAMHEINNGEYADLPEDPARERDEYESALDDAVEAALEKWHDVLSADWLGKNTVDTGLWHSTDEDRTLVQKLAESAAKEVFKQLTLDKTPAQILANAGILTADVTAYAENQNPKTGDTNVADNLDDVIAKTKTHLGKDFDQMSVYDDLEMVIEEDDDILAGSAASRLGMSEEDVAVMQMAALDMDDGPSDVLELLKAYTIPSGRKKTAEAKKEKAEAKAKTEEGAVDVLVLSNLKDCGAGDTAMAEALGVSRSTYVNYLKGKTAFAPDADQYAHVRAELVTKANQMLEALAALDGTELMQVA